MRHRRGHAARKTQDEISHPKKARGSFKRIRPWVPLAVAYRARGPNDDAQNDADGSPVPRLRLAVSHPDHLLLAQGCAEVDRQIAWAASQCRPQARAAQAADAAVDNYYRSPVAAGVAGAGVAGADVAAVDAVAADVEVDAAVADIAVAETDRQSAARWESNSARDLGPYPSGCNHCNCLARLVRLAHQIRPAASH